MTKQHQSEISEMKIKDIKNWFEVALPNPTIEQACIQVGCHYEEIAEMMDPLAEEYGTDGVIGNIAIEYKSAEAEHVEHLNMLSSHDRVKLLDSLCDQIVTAIGVAHTLGMDIEGALAEVNASNHSKFEDGKPVFNEQGKISKGKHYRAPELQKFI